MSSSEQMSKFLEIAAGRFVGSEELVVDPESGATMKATAHMENTPVLGGCALRSSYRQVVDGVVGMRCETIIRLLPDGDVVLVWTPSEGEPAIYAGKLRGMGLDVSRNGADGITQRILTDYGNGSVVSNEMTMTFPGVDDPVNVFSGRYEAQGPVKGREMWRDLTVPDAEQAKVFYAKVLGVTPEAADMGGYADYEMLDEAGETAFGVCHARGVNADLPSVWLPYFAVASADEAKITAEELGGEVVAGPKAFGPYKYFILRDPAGASFVVCEQE